MITGWRLLWPLLTWMDRSGWTRAPCWGCLVGCLIYECTHAELGIVGWVYGDGNEDEVGGIRPGNAAGLSVFYSRYDNRRSTRTQLVHVRSSGSVVLAFLIVRHPNSCSLHGGDVVGQGPGPSSPTFEQSLVSSKNGLVFREIPILDIHLGYLDAKIWQCSLQKPIERSSMHPAPQICTIASYPIAHGRTAALCPYTWPNIWLRS